MSTVAQLEEVKSGPWSGGKSPFSVEYGKLMMWFFLLSDVFTFSALLIFYGAMRFKSLSWPDPDVVFQSAPGIPHGAPLVFVGIMTFILIFSSVTMVLAVEAGHRNSKSEVVKWLILTVIGGFTFLGCQAWEWSHLIHEGMTLHHNPFMNADGSTGAVQFGQLFFVITGFHGFHVFTGVVINLVILINAIAGTYERRGHYLMVEKVGLYWHFVDLVWVFVFTLFYLV
ncbi:cytochrome c oxidase subunit 3 [Solitalea canadensis]|uniref:Heme/copper-type cytochrome/quinol oxidase, subunit 3 n=1 Tax=Solitalea canadensis (strain ATCC 29591 / DSM 3403 / JCM 21819 / LMG 8368 / NBRC 15130 / NCIMB 12057 / USAM 9D) TaxID=929556 RepID=H8KX36_SOLCM|nr:cytochrome c oxidase subunit 3 [Solitalea canadensis]AFD08365.1 heme/copper-type cytochrome/quinol oxidase, subunit 3 [Solitalea canadensis DSM 3403]